LKTLPFGGVFYGVEWNFFNAYKEPTLLFKHTTLVFDKFVLNDRFTKRHFICYPGAVCFSAKAIFIKWLMPNTM